jgi:hypothetical protein|tara:strand:- start:738 stop:1451 length:714 start_codon:yes stop_codon:yes gene_type:complete
MTPTSTKTLTISEETYQILVNFSTINSSIVFKKGNLIRTIANAENILGEYVSEEYIPQDFAIYDLSEFISAIGICARDNSLPTLHFDNDDYVTIKGGNLSIRYYFSDPQITLKVAPEKEVKFPGSNISFTINQSDLKNLRDALAKFNLPEVLFRSRDGKVTVHGVDTENATSNTFWMDFPSGQSTGDFDLTLNTENLRVARNYDYHVKVSEHLLSEWAVVGPTKDLQLKYYIALEPK